MIYVARRRLRLARQQSSAIFSRNVYSTQTNEHNSYLEPRKPELLFLNHAIAIPLPPLERASYRLLFSKEQRDLGVDGSHYQPHRSQKQEYQRHRSNERRENQKESHHYGSPGEEREGETSGYASDSVDVPQAGQSTLF